MFRKISALIFSVLLAFGILAAMLWRVWGDLTDTLQFLHPLYLVPAVVICFLAWILRGWRVPDHTWKTVSFCPGPVFNRVYLPFPDCQSCSPCPAWRSDPDHPGQA